MTAIAATPLTDAEIMDPDTPQMPMESGKAVEIPLVEIRQREMAN